MNNRKTAAKVQLIFTLLVIVFTGLWICTITINILSHTALQLTFGGLALLTFIYFMTGGFYYFEIDQPDDHFEVKFYNTFPFSREFKMYRIPINAFIKYEIVGNKLYKRKLMLFQMSANQMAKYPPIYISAFSEKDDEALRHFFDNIKKES
jgi:hypothetical protein